MKPAISAFILFFLLVSTPSIAQQNLNEGDGWAEWKEKTTQDMAVWEQLETVKMEAATRIDEASIHQAQIVSQNPLLKTMLVQEFEKALKNRGMDCKLTLTGKNLTELLVRVEEPGTEPLKVFKAMAIPFAMERDAGTLDLFKSIGIYKVSFHVGSTLYSEKSLDRLYLQTRYFSLSQASPK